MKFFNRTKTDQFVIAAINGQQCRLHHFRHQSNELLHIAGNELDYSNPEALEQALVQWCKNNQVRNVACRWLLGRELYQTYNIEPPKVLEHEMSEAIKWQIKDLLDYPVEQVLVNYYRLKSLDSNKEQVVAVVVEKALIEALINMSRTAGLDMNAIEIEELSLGHGLLNHLSEDKIVGYIGEDSSGLVFNFYHGDELAFTRHKKGRFMPLLSTDEFSLESEQQEKQDAFLLETQRTLDYAISQLFRKPVDKLLLDAQQGDVSSLAESINQLTETPVVLVAPSIKNNENAEKRPIYPRLTETASALRIDK